MPPDVFIVVSLLLINRYRWFVVMAECDDVHESRNSTCWYPQTKEYNWKMVKENHMNYNCLGRILAINFHVAASNDQCWWSVMIAGCNDVCERRNPSCGLAPSPRRKVRGKIVRGNHWNYNFLEGILAMFFVLAFWMDQHWWSAVAVGCDDVCGRRNFSYRFAQNKGM